MEPQISIVIISLNEEKFLPLLLSDLTEQTEKNFEVLVVDGKSEDKTKEKTLTYQNKLNLHFIESPKRQLSYQRNLGAHHAQGTYLYFLDADTRINKNAIATCLQHINQHKYKVFIPIVVPAKRRFFISVLFSIATRFVIIMQKLGVPYTFGPGVLIEKNLFKTIGGYDEKAYVAEDQNLIVRVFKAGFRPKILYDLVYVYSLRRFESHGYFKTIIQYVWFNFVSLFRGAVYSKNITYTMGGQEYKKTNKTKSS